MAYRSLACLATWCLVSGALADWPQWRGPERTALSPETGLLQEWPTEGPALLWTHRDLGFGYAAPAIAGDRLYILGSEEESAVAIASRLSRLWTGRNSSTCGMMA